MNPRIWCFDLEMNQPTHSIIQIGGVIGDIRTGNIIDSFDFKINCNETLNPEIIELTGLKQSDVDNGVDINLAIKEVEGKISLHKCCRSPVVWGNGDLRHLKSQNKDVSSQIQGIFREIDIKTIHQMIMLSQGKSMRGGLEASLKHYGLKFDGQPHDALTDAKNTFKLAVHLHKELKHVTLCKLI